jgi:hypothetical protein
MRNTSDHSLFVPSSKELGRVRTIKVERLHGVINTNRAGRCAQ